MPFKGNWIFDEKRQIGVRGPEIGVERLDNGKCPPNLLFAGFDIYT